MSPLQLKALLEEIKNAIPGINKSWTVVDDSQLSKKISDCDDEDNMLLVGVLPNYGTTGANADSYRDTTQSMIMVLEKTDYSDLDDDEFIDLFERTFQVARAVRNYILEISSEGCNSALRNIFVDSLTIEPIWKKADCNGWSINFDIE